MPNYLCLSGWGQKFDSLNIIFDCLEFSKSDIFHLDYSALNSFKDLCNFVRSHHQDLQKFDTVVGWSLGGQLSCRLIANKIISPKKLILIAPPFQFVKDGRINAAMPQSSYLKFMQDFKDCPNATLKKFSILTSLNDINAKKIAKNIDINNKNYLNLLNWLNELGDFSCFDINFSNFCEVLYFHGKGDMIVNIRQYKYFKERMANFSEIIFDNCGHAPHLSDLTSFRYEILKFESSYR